MAAASSPKRTRLKQLQGRVNRATPLVRAALQGDSAEHPKTRSLLGAETSPSVVPSDERYRDKLLKAVGDPSF